MRHNIIELIAEESRYIASLPSKDFHTRETWHKIQIADAKVKRDRYKELRGLAKQKDKSLLHPKLQEELKNLI